MKTAKEIAAEYQVTDRHIINLVTDGTIPGPLVGSDWRFDAVAFRQALQEDTVIRLKLRAEKAERRG